MLRVTVELWRYGDPSDREVLAVMDVFNDLTGTPTRGNYGYRVYRKPRAGATPMAKHPKTREGRVMNYPRKSLPVWELVKRVLLDAFKEKSTK